MKEEFLEVYSPKGIKTGQKKVSQRFIVKAYFILLYMYGFSQKEGIY